MRQRYYNTEIKRFVNQDILTGSAGNSQSLNRYSYVQGNPVKYTDPFGLSPINGLFSGSNIRHALLGFASCIPVIGVMASAADAWFYYKEGNTAMAMACTVDAVIGLLSGGGSLLTKFAKTEQIGRAIQVAAKIGNGGVGLYRNATTFGKSAVDFYVRHEGTFFTKNFQWELADAGDFLSMALSGAGAAQSAAGLASGINEAAKAYRQWKEINALKNSYQQNTVRIKGNQPENGGVGGSGSKKIINVGAGKKPIPCAVNIDINPTVEGVGFGDVYDLSQFSDGTFDHVIALNPRYDVLGSDIPRVIKSGGRLTITGNYSNDYFSVIYDSINEMGNFGFNVISTGNQAPIFSKYGGYHSDGVKKVKGNIMQIILEKK